MEVINLLFEEFRVFQKLEVYEWFCIRGGIIDPYTTSYLLFCVMVSCFAGYVITRSARRKAGRLAWSAIWGDHCSTQQFSGLRLPLRLASHLNSNERPTHVPCTRSSALSCTRLIGAVPL